MTNAVKAAMLSGARISELLNAKRADFDFESGVWTVPPENSKTNLPIRRPITAGLMSILEEQWNLYRSDLCFPSPTNGKTPVWLTSVTKYVREINARLDMPKWRLHDFRRTITTRLSESGVLPHVTEKILGHTLGGVMAVYNKHDWLDDQRKAYDMWADKVFLAARGDKKIAMFEKRA
ncbi:hypothetical protein NFHSH190041_20390 [Shewanella sp. NFH-SH190041]|nr:hypothetical protein NFHSH190041_20390 [Shewanella sp. NFH-SH190041]